MTKIKRTDKSFAEMLNHLDDLLKSPHLNSEAKNDVAHMHQLHASHEFRLDNLSSLGLMYSFLTHEQSPAGATLRACLHGYAGDLWSLITGSSVELSAHGNAITSAFELNQMAVAAEVLGRPIGSGDFFNAILNHNSNREVWRALRDKAPVRNFSVVSNASEFFKERGLEPEQLLMRLHGYAIPDLDPQAIADRFTLTIRILDSGLIRAEVQEKWGRHTVEDSEVGASFSAGLWLPEKTVFLDSEITEFEKLLNSNPPAREQAFQEFFEAHPKWLYLLGEQYEAARSQISLPSVSLAPELGFTDGSVESSDLRPDFMLKRIGLDLWDVLDIKRPDARAVVGRPSRRKFSEAVADAVAQLREYRRRISQAEVRVHLQDALGIAVSEPIAMVVIGRDTDFKSLYEKSVLREQDGVRVYTYDDLRRLARHRQLRV